MYENGPPISETDQWQAEKSHGSGPLPCEGGGPPDGGLSMRDARKPIAGQPCSPRDGRAGARKSGLETPQTQCV